MLTCYSSVDRFNRRLLLFILVGVLVITCDGLDHPFINADDDPCPLIETLSFGSDIDIKCNKTYLIFNEINNNNKLNWIFANQSSYCQKKEKIEDFVNQCNINRIKSKYLKVRLKSAQLNEYGCVYCRINYKPIAPIISVTQSDAPSYTFNLTATGLDRNEFFEILWAKRVNYMHDHSFNYWFLQRCIADEIKILQNIGHSIVFTVDDTNIRRVEFIIRRCNGTCRTYEECSNDEFNTEVSSTNFPMPDSIEKISCNDDCLKGIIPSPPPTPPSTTTMNNPIKKENALSSTMQLLKEKQTIKFLILFSILGLLIALSFIMLVCFVLSKIKGLRSDNIYTKTSNINLDEK